MLSSKGKNYSLKAFALIVLLCILMSMLNNCSEEKDHPRSYPRVKTNPVTGITEKGATFSGDIFSMGTEPIIEHGFVWNDGPYPDLSDGKVLLGPTSSGGVYTADIVSSLARNVEYTVKSFVKTADHIVYGLPVTFVSLGSGAPVVTGFSPDSAVWLDTIKISGKNFALETKVNVVKLGQVQCNVISGTDTTLLVEVNPGISEIKNLVSVEILGNKSEYIADTFRLIPPAIKEILPAKAAWGDTIAIKGVHFRAYYSDKTNYIKLGAINCERVKWVTDSIIYVKVPNDLTAILSRLTMKINGINLEAPQKFELLSPFFTFSPKNGTWRSTITLSGKFNPVASRNQVTLKTDGLQYILQPGDMVSSSSNSIIFRIPLSFAARASAINYASTPFSITPADSFRLNPPVITSFSPVSGRAGSQVTIKGKYFHPLYNTVRFGGNEVQILSTTDSTLTVIAPSIAADQVQIGVISMNQSAVSTGTFQYINPKISGVSPLTGTFGDEVIITGQNFESPGVVLGGQYGLDIVSSTATQIVVRIPDGIDSIPRTFQVTCGLSSVVSAEKFTLLPPQITSVSPNGIVQASQEITVTGDNFDPVANNNSLYWDITPLHIKSATKTQIVATLPEGIPRGTFVLRVNTGGYLRSSSQTLTVNRSFWMRIASPEIPSTFSDGYWGSIIYGQASNSRGYVCSEADGKTYRFDPSDNSWTTLNIPSPFDGSSRYVMMGQVVNMDSIYLIGGLYGNGMKVLHDGKAEWNSLPLPPQRSGVAFSLNNKIYFGLNFYQVANLDFYECDPSNNYSWTRLSDFPISYGYQFSTYFTVGGKGYVLFSDNTVYQFDPVDYSWHRMANFPGASRLRAFSFVLDGVAYVGGGEKAAYYSAQPDDLWAYSPDADAWGKVSVLPGIRYSAVAFSIGTKAYVGFGVKNPYGYPTNLYDFYEFDPSYMAK